MRPENLNTTLTALPVEQLAKLLRHAGSELVTEDHIRSDIAAGAPTNPDGTMNLVIYGSWLIRELARRGAARE